MHDTASQAVKQESKRKRGFCVKVAPCNNFCDAGNKHGEKKRGVVIGRVSFSVARGKLARRTRVILYHEVCLD